jgi:glucose-1-phosphate cytidylyltransferase
VRHLLEGEEIFLANYGDTLTDAPLDQLVEAFRASDAVASFLAVKPANYPFSIVATDGNQRVTRLVRPLDSDLWINGGYFALRRAIFDAIEPGEELVEAPFSRLIAGGKLHATRYEGFWAPMDTLRELEHLESLTASGRAPWALWDGERVEGPVAPTATITSPAPQ